MSAFFWIPSQSNPSLNKKLLHSLIVPFIIDGDCYDACKIVAHHCVNGNSEIKGIDFDKILQSSGTF